MLGAGKAEGEELTRKRKKGKQCPACSEFVGCRTISCVCGYTFESAIRKVKPDGKDNKKRSKVSLARTYAVCFQSMVFPCATRSMHSNNTLPTTRCHARCHARGNMCTGKGVSELQAKCWMQDTQLSSLWPPLCIRCWKRWWQPACKRR
jgi:hypothetical protein